MANTLEIELHNRQQAWVAIKSRLFPFLKEVLQNGRRLVLVVKERQRTSPQNRRYWGKGVLAQIAEQAVVNGKQYGADEWHEVFKQMFIGVKELPNGRVVGMSSKELSTTEFSDFCTQVEAYAATELGVTFYDLQH
jgi:hypothetical protein